MSDKQQDIIFYSIVGFCIILFLVFATLRILEYIDWSWWLITAPIWIPMGIFFGGFLIVIIIGFICALFRKDINQ